MKQTAVEWLVEQLDGEKHLSTNEINRIIQQANKMFEKQIIKAYETAMETDIYNEPLKIGKDYYNENFKQND